MKKIVLVTGNTKGGIIQFLETLESVLSEIGFEITVVAPAEIEKKLQSKKKLYLLSNNCRKFWIYQKDKFFSIQEKGVC